MISFSLSNGEKIHAHIYSHAKPEDTKLRRVNCVRVQADGDELNYIIRNMKGLPTISNRIVVWEGQFANFIFRNFCWLK